MMRLTWENTPFGELYLEPSRNGLTRPTSVRGSGYKMVNMGELYSYPRLKDPEMDRVPMSEAERSKFALESGDLLFARQSLVLEGAGKCSIVLDCEKDTTFESHLIRVRLDPEKAAPLFFYYFFRSGTGTGTMQTIVNQVAAAGIRGSDLQKLKILNPPLSTQRKIAAILTAYDDLIEVNKRRIALLENMAEEIYREWFVRLRFPGHQNARFVKGVPEGWDKTQLGKFAHFTMGQSPKSEFYNDAGEGLPFHQGVGTYGSRFPNTVTYCSVDGRRAFKGNILFSVRAPVGRLNIADCDMIIGRGLAAIKHVNGMNSYLYYLLKSVFASEDIIGNGAIFNSVGKDELARFALHRHPASLVQNFEDIAWPIDQQIETLIHATTNLTQTRDLLLPRLISGKLSVEDLNIQFPPSMLEAASAADAEPDARHA